MNNSLKIKVMQILLRKLEDIIEFRFTSKNNEKSLKSFLVGILHNHICILTNQVFILSLMYLLFLCIYYLSNLLIAYCQTLDAQDTVLNEGLKDGL